MGCWNETCYVSKLPIYSGEEVVLILLRKNDVSHEELPHTSYVYEKYVPFGLPIYGKYDDYGNIEEITNADDVIEYLKDMEITDNKGDDVDMESLTSENLTEFTGNVLRGRYLLKEELGKDTPLFGMMVKKALYDRLLNHYKNRKCYKEEVTYEEHIRDEITSKIDEIIKEYEDVEKEGTKEFLQEMALDRIYIARITGIDKYNDIIPVLRNKFFKEKDTKALDYLIDIIFFKLCLQALRMGYYCISGAGSQSREMLIHREVANFILEETEKAVKEYKENNDDDATYQEILSEKLFFWGKKYV